MSLEYRAALLKKTFGLLTVVAFAGIDQTGKTVWHCRCKCGNPKEVRGDSLRRCKVKSCGCLLRRVRSQNPRWQGTGELGKQWWSRLLLDAKSRRIPVLIDMAYAWKLFEKQHRQCALTGVPIKMRTSSKKFDGSASLDRIDSQKGYVVGNVQWVDKRVNRMKQHFNQTEFIGLCAAVTDFKRGIIPTAKEPVFQTG